MSTSHLRLIATVAVIAAAALTGAITGLLSAQGDAMFEVTVAATGFIGALIAGGVVVGLLGARLTPPFAGNNPASTVATGPDETAL
ncbi:MAG: hypothetical protein ACRD0P_18905, partial [Stackebrandtia sp.]